MHLTWRPHPGKQIQKHQHHSELLHRHHRHKDEHLYADPAKRIRCLRGQSRLRENRAAESVYLSIRHYSKEARSLARFRVSLPGRIGQWLYSRMRSQTNEYHSWQHHSRLARVSSTTASPPGTMNIPLPPLFARVTLIKANLVPPAGTYTPNF